MTTRIQAVSSGPRISDRRGVGAMRNRSKNPLSMSRTVLKPRPTPLKPEPMQQRERQVPVDRAVGGEAGDLGDGEEGSAERDRLEDRHHQRWEERRRQTADAAQAAQGKAASGAQHGPTCCLSGGHERGRGHRAASLPRKVRSANPIEKTPIAAGTSSALATYAGRESIDHQPTDSLPRGARPG